MPDVIFGYFCIFINLLELYSGKQLNYLGPNWSFWVLLYDLLGGFLAMLSLGLIIPHLWDKTFLNAIPTSLWIMSFPVWLVGTSSIPNPVWASDTVPSNPFRWFFLENHCFMYFVCVCLNFLVVSSGIGNLASVTPSWPEAEVSYQVLMILLLSNAWIYLLLSHPAASDPDSTASCLGWHS